jgi:hypothetical protein
MKDDCKFHTKFDGSYWVNDAMGIPLARVCEDCEEEKLSKFRPEVFDSRSDAWGGEASDYMNEG